MKRYKCSNYECPECMWGTCHLDNPEDKHDKQTGYGDLE